MTAWRARQGSDRDSGLTLVELLVAMSVGVVLLAAVGTVFVGALRTLSSVNSKAELSTSSDIAMRAITERLRAADYRQPEAAAGNSAVQAASATSVSVNVYLPDVPLATSLSAAITAVSPGNTLASWMTITGLVPKLVEFRYLPSSPACAGRPGVVQTTTPPRVFLSGGQVLAWDTGATSQCILRTTTVPDASAPLFRYYTGCALTDPESSTDLAAIEGIQVRLAASDSTTPTPLVLQNRVCLVNVTEGTV